MPRNERYYPALGAISRVPEAPPGTLGTNGFRDSLNLVPQDGLLRQRPRLVNFVWGSIGSPTYSYGAGIEYEFPLVILTANAPGVKAATSVSGAPCANVYTFSNDGPLAAIVTTRHIWIYNETAAAWINATPTYTTGTVTATNGSPNVAGAGTAWTTSGLSPYQWILIDGAWYQICTITSNVALTLTSNFTGATAPGKAYTIRRNWNLSRDGTLGEACLVSATMYNQNLYVAGRAIGRADNNVAPAVIRVSDIFTAATTTTYLTASTALIPGLDVISDLTDITGIQALQDGRVVFTGAGSTGPSTFFFSSPTDQSVWTVSPAGRTSVVYLEGAITALGRVGNVLTLHYEQGIVLGYPTNQSEPPVAFQPSNATQGCFCPRTLQTHDGIEYYVTSTAMPTAFDLHSSRQIGTGIRNQLQYFLLKSQVRVGLHAAIDAYRNRYTVYWQRLDEGESSRGATFDLALGTWYPIRIPAKITAVSIDNPFRQRSCLVGTVNVVSGVETDFLRAFVEGYFVDDVGTGATGGFWFDTEDLDFEAPLLYKTPVAVTIFYRGEEATAGQIVCAISVDGGATWVDAAFKTITPAVAREAVTRFSFLDLVAAASMFRVRFASGITGTSPTGGAMYVIPTRMVVEANIGGDLRQVEL